MSSFVGEEDEEDEGGRETFTNLLPPGTSRHLTRVCVCVSERVSVCSCCEIEKNGSVNVCVGKKKKNVKMRNV